MGSRANLLLIENGTYHLYYCHWCAGSLPNDMFWGPEHVRPFISRQRRVNKDDWLDDVGAEGGVLIDNDRRKLLLYGGEDIKRDIPLRRLYLDLLHEVWTEWDVQWAYEGIFDLADHVGLRRNKVMGEVIENEQFKSSWLIAPKKELVRVVASFVFEDSELRLFPLVGLIRPYLKIGPSLIEFAKREPGLDYVPLNEWLDSPLWGGFHIDVAKKEIAYWTANEANLARRIPPFWPGWKALWLKDNFEYQLAQTQNRLIFSSRSDENLLSDLKRSLLYERRSTADTVGETAEIISRELDLQIEVNPLAWRDDLQDVPLVTRRRILDKAIAAWRQRSS